MNTQHAVNYHYRAFPPRNLTIDQMLRSPLKATDALARYDQVLKSLHKTEFFLALLRNQEAVISSRMEGIISTLDEFLLYEADFDENSEEDH